MTKLKAGRKGLYFTRVQPKLKEIAEMREKGASDIEIIKALKISHDSFYRYLRERTEFSDIMRKASENALEIIENALYRSAKGYEYEETEIIGHYRDGAFVTDKIRKIKKYASPSTTAQIFILKNKAYHKWNDRRDINVNARVQPVSTPEIDLAKLPTELLEQLVSYAESSSDTD